MPLSPGSILAKLDELKKWQQQQQNRLLQQGIQAPSKSYSVTNLSVIEPSITLKRDENVAKGKPKQPFLKRGAGLSRFHMCPGEQFKPFINDTKKVKTNEPKRVLTPLKKPNATITPRELPTPKAVWEPPETKTKDRDLLIFEALEERATHNSFSSTNSSVLRLLASTPNKTPIKNDYPKKDEYSQIIEENDEMNEFEKKIQSDYFNLIEKALQFKQYMNQDVTHHSSASSLTDETENVRIENYNDENHWTDLEVCTTKSSSSSSRLSLISVKEDATRTVETMTDNLPDEEAQNKLAQLEKDLKSVRVESNKLRKIKEQHEQQVREFERYKKEIVKQVEDEKEKLVVMLEEERKKLGKEKMVFERYVKDLQNKPSRKEREEIAALKMEVATLQETLKLKETKNGTTQARLRNQIKTLEKENTNLKEEINELNKQNAKLIVSQKINRRPSSTKMLHEFNKNLSELTRKHFQCKESEEFLKENNKNASNLISEVDFQIEQEPTKLEKNDRIEKILSDGTKQIRYSNGNLKTISPDGNLIIFQYFNGDVKETNLLEGTICYHYHENKVNHTTNSDGTELIQFPDGQIERRLKDGVCEIEYPNGIKRKTYPDGIEEITYPDGMIVNIQNDERIMTLPNGQKEIHTSEHKRREYPDGTVKILYPDGSQETRYANGRIRLKDKYGKLVADSLE